MSPHFIYLAIAVLAIHANPILGGEKAVGVHPASNDAHSTAHQISKRYQLVHNDCGPHFELDLRNLIGYCEGLYYSVKQPTNLPNL